MTISLSLTSGRKARTVPLPSYATTSRLPDLSKANDRLLGDFADHLGPAFLRRPAVNAVLAGVGEIDRAFAVHRRPGDVQEAVGEFLDPGAVGEDARV